MQRKVYFIKQMLKKPLAPAVAFMYKDLSGNGMCLHKKPFTTFTFKPVIILYANHLFIL